MSVREVKLPQVIIFVLNEMRQAGFEAYIVGGAVRDCLIQQPTHDWDITTNATPEKIQELFPHSFYPYTPSKENKE